MNVVTVRVELVKNKAILADQCRVADSYFSRLVGLMGQGGLPAGEGVWLRPCNSIHMWFMKFPIDVLFITPATPAEQVSDKAVYRVTSVVSDLAPWKLLPVSDFRAADAVELPQGVLARSGVAKGDLVCIS